MKKSLLLIISIFTAGCAACFAGCAKDVDSPSETRAPQTIIDTEDDLRKDAPDGNREDADKCPEHNCKRKDGPHARRKHGKKKPAAEMQNICRKRDSKFKFRFPRPDDAPDSLPSKNGGQDLPEGNG